MILNPAHNLLGCRFDNLLRLLKLSHWKLDPKRLPQTAVIFFTSLLLYPAALLEKAIMAGPIRREKIQDPVFIIGHWRSGTSFLQNVLTRDPALGFSDPVCSATYPYCRLLAPMMRRIQRKALVDARPMDNLKYGLDFPIEDTFAVSSVTPYSIILMCSLPNAYDYYVKTAFVEDLSEKEHAEFRRTYDTVLRKLSYMKGHRRLICKSPDNTCRLRDLMDMYPNAKYIHIYRDPYVTVKSTIHMFSCYMERLRITPPPDTDLEILMEDTIVGIFERMYREYFALKDQIPAENLIELRYEDFSDDPMRDIDRIYKHFGFDRSEEARRLQQEHVDSQKGYVKNKFVISPRLRDKVTEHLGFYMEHYGYTPKTEE